MSTLKAILICFLVFSEEQHTACTTSVSRLFRLFVCLFACIFKARQLHRVCVQLSRKVPEGLLCAACLFFLFVCVVLLFYFSRSG